VCTGSYTRGGSVSVGFLEAIVDFCSSGLVLAEDTGMQVAFEALAKSSSRASYPFGSVP